MDVTSFCVPSSAEWTTTPAILDALTPPRLGQSAFPWFKPRAPKPEKPRKKPRRYRLLAKDLKDGPRVTFRCSPKEAEQMVAAMKERKIPTLSEFIRDCLYEAAAIGEFGEEA